VEEAAVSDPAQHHQSPEWLTWGCAALGFLAAIGLMVFCAFNCSQCGAKDNPVVEKFGDRWELRKSHKLYPGRTLYHHHRRGEWQAVLSGVADYEKDDNLVFFLTSGDHYAVLDLETNSLREFDRLEDAPPEWRKPLRKLR
jgi:hypothetical protein